MSQWIDIPGAVVGATVYRNNKCVAKDVNFTLPEVSPQTVELKAMGSITMPLPGLVEAMEATVTKIGVDEGFRQMAPFESATYEFRWAATKVQADGNTKTFGCKAFLRVNNLKVPGVSVELGSQQENEFTLATTRYQLLVNGVEYILVDKLACICKIHGTDYAKTINSLL